jgi:hypothetical protein
VKDHARTLNLWLRLSQASRDAGKHRKKGMHMNYDSVGDYDVPVDPMDDLQCESCQ